MDEELPLAVRGLDDGEKLLARIGRIAAIVRIAPERRMIGPGQIGGEALDGAVAHDLDAAALHLAAALQAGIVPIEIVIGIIVHAHGQQTTVVRLLQDLRAVVVQHAGVKRRGDAARRVDLARDAGDVLHLVIAGEHGQTRGHEIEERALLHHAVQGTVGMVADDAAL